MILLCTVFINFFVAIWCAIVSAKAIQKGELTYAIVTVVLGMINIAMCGMNLHRYIMKLMEM